jgi:hypothetical protein
MFHLRSKEMAATVSMEQWQDIQSKILLDFKNGTAPQGGLDTQVRVDLPNGDFQLIHSSYAGQGTEPIRVLQ